MANIILDYQIIIKNYYFLAKHHQIINIITINTISFSLILITMEH